MPQVNDTLETPVLLIAMPQIQDMVFNRSIVLLLEHSPEGSLGLVLNRPTELVLRELLEPFDIRWNGEILDRAFLGGPVSPEVGTLLFRAGTSEHDSDDRVVAVAGDLLLTQDIDLLREIAVAPPDDVRLILGYAGWTGGQLESEIERSDWLLAPLETDLVFATDPLGQWSAALATIGVRPESLPSFSPGSEISN